MLFIHILCLQFIPVLLNNNYKQLNLVEMQLNYITNAFESFKFANKSNVKTV